MRACSPRPLERPNSNMIFTKPCRETLRTCTKAASKSSASSPSAAKATPSRTTMFRLSPEPRFPKTTFLGQTAPDLAFVLREVAADHRQIEAGEDRFLRFALEQEFKRSPHEFFRLDFSICKSRVIVRADCDVVRCFAPSFDDSDTKFGINNFLDFNCCRHKISKFDFTNCSACLQAGKCLILRCRPEGRRYKIVAACGVTQVLRTW